MGILMTPRLRKATFLAHVTVSLGWLGSVLAYLALAVSGLISKDAILARSAYVSMEIVGWTVIVPLSLATLLTGLIQSLGTEWGLFRHYWITAKFLMATVSSVILLMHMSVVGQMSGVARGSTLSNGAFSNIRAQLIVHASGGLLVLLVATVLSIYKPWGPTPYGRRIQQEKSLPAPASPESGKRLGRYIALGIIGLILLFLVVHHLTGSGPRHH